MDVLSPGDLLDERNIEAGLFLQTLEKSEYYKDAEDVSTLKILHNILVRA
jgi:hypothetical protein